MFLLQIPGFQVTQGLSCVIGMFGPLGPAAAAAATLRQHCPQMTQTRCIYSGQLSGLKLVLIQSADLQLWSFMFHPRLGSNSPCNFYLPSANRTTGQMLQAKHGGVSHTKPWSTTLLLFFVSIARCCCRCRKSSRAEISLESLLTLHS